MWGLKTLHDVLFTILVASFFSEAFFLEPVIITQFRSNFWKNSSVFTFFQKPFLTRPFQLPPNSDLFQEKHEFASFTLLLSENHWLVYLDLPAGQPYHFTSFDKFANLIDNVAFEKTSSKRSWYKVCFVRKKECELHKVCVYFCKEIDCGMSARDWSAQLPRA